MHFSSSIIHREKSEQPKHFHFQHVKLNLPIATYKYNIPHISPQPVLGHQPKESKPRLPKKNKTPRITQVYQDASSAHIVSSLLCAGGNTTGVTGAATVLPPVTTVFRGDRETGDVLLGSGRTSSTFKCRPRDAPATSGRACLGDVTSEIAGGSYWRPLDQFFLKNRPGHIRPTSRLVYMRDWFVQLCKYT